MGWRQRTTTMVTTRRKIITTMSIPVTCIVVTIITNNPRNPTNCIIWSRLRCTHYRRPRHGSTTKHNSYWDAKVVMEITTTTTIRPVVVPYLPPIYRRWYKRDTFPIVCNHHHPPPPHTATTTWHTWSLIRSGIKTSFARW